MKDAMAYSTAIGANAIGEPMRTMEDIGIDVPDSFQVLTQ